ncbi:MAG: hypothetical protein U0Q18_28115 [Bryobacteraceae bacterium]
MQTIARNRMIGLVLVMVLFSCSASGRSRRKRRTAVPGSFAYYLLVLSYAPNFCDQPQGNKDPLECGSGRKIGFVVHGLWPQGESSRGPESCAPASPVAQTIVQTMLRYIPTESLIQHEWAAHGTCTGLSPTEYFGLVAKARDSVAIPPDLAQPLKTLHLSPSSVESEFAAANASFPPAAFRTSCYKDGEFNEIRICLNQDLSPRACGVSAGECTTPTATVLPVR